MLSREDCLVAAAAADGWPIGDSEVWVGRVKGMNRSDRGDPERALQVLHDNPAVPR
jgi:hypothetical protein